MTDNDDFRSIQGRRGPYLKGATINYLKGYFIVQFYDENNPELFVINDENTNVSNNEVKSSSPLAKAVMHNEQGSSFFIEDYLEKDFDTKTGVSVIRKELEYLNYDPRLDGKVQYNYYYIKSYLDYVKPRTSELKREFSSNGQQIFINLKFIPYYKLEEFLKEIIEILSDKRSEVEECLSIKHLEDIDLKIAKLKDMKHKRFYQEDLDYIELDIKKFICYDLNYYLIMDLYIEWMKEKLQSIKKKGKRVKNVLFDKLNKMLESNTISESIELFNEIQEELKKLYMRCIPKLKIEYSEFNSGCDPSIIDIIKLYEKPSIINEGKCSNDYFSLEPIDGVIRVFNPYREKRDYESYKYSTGRYNEFLPASSPNSDDLFDDDVVDDIEIKPLDVEKSKSKYSSNVIGTLEEEIDYNSEKKSLDYRNHSEKRSYNVNDVIGAIEFCFLIIIALFLLYFSAILGIILLFSLIIALFASEGGK